MDTEIQTTRLFMRRSCPADLEAMHALVSDYEVVKMTATWPWPADRDFTASRCTPYPAENGMIGPVFAAGELVGTMGVNMGEDGPGMGYMFARTHWGKGYATEIGCALIAHAWQRYDWTHLRASVFNGNPASVRVLEKLGFTANGTGEGPCRARGTILPMHNFVLTRPNP